MSIIEKLTEGIVNRDMKAEGAALLNKWSATGLLEGLDSQHQQATMARLLENQAKELLREASSMTAGDVDGFAAVAFPIVRRVFAGLIANDLVSVQPMSLPSGLIFFLDFVYSPTLNGTDVDGRNRFGNIADRSIYGTDRVGSQVTGGVNLVGSLKENLSGPRQTVGYAYGSPVEVGTIAQANASAQTIAINSSMTDEQQKDLKYDPDLLSSIAANTHSFIKVTVNAAGVAALETAGADFDNLAAFVISGSALSASTDLGPHATSAPDTDLVQIRRLTHFQDGELVFIFHGLDGKTGPAHTDTTLDNADLTVEYPEKDQLSATAGSPAGGIDTFRFPLEGSSEIPEIDIKVDSIAITAQTKKLKAKWTPELGQDLNAYHNLDAEVELTSILSEQIALEIDREILADLVNGATAATYYWSRSPGLFVNRETGKEVGASAKAPDFTGTVSEWYETLIETINDVSAQIHLKTLRGGANYIVCGPEVANILEFTSGFRANVTADADKGEIGAVKVGSLSRKFDVIVDPYFPRNAILVGRKGNSFLESGYVYAPYVPLQTTPTIFGVEDFVPRKGVMTRYAKKMVRPDMYGLVICRGLLGESGS